MRILPLPNQLVRKKLTKQILKPSEKLAAIVAQLDAFASEYLCLDMSDTHEAAAQLEGVSESLECEGL